MSGVDAPRTYASVTAASTSGWRRAYRPSGAVADPPPHAPHAHRDLAGRRHHAPCVPAVPDVDALVTALVRPGPDEVLQIPVDDELKDRLYRAPHAR